MRGTPLTRGGASSIYSVAPALEAVIPKKLNAKKARKVPDAVAAGDPTAYRHF
jgi:hypothetical protein